MKAICIRRFFTLCTFLSLLVMHVAHADELTPEYKSDILQLFKETKTLELAQSAVENASNVMLAPIRQSYPTLSQAGFEKIKNQYTTIIKNALASPTDGYLDQLAAIYAKYYTHAEIRELLKFYQTPLGQKSIAFTPKILEEDLHLGQKIGGSVAPNIAAAFNAVLKEEGLLK